MRIETDKYLVTTDDREQFVLQMKKVVSDSPKLKDKSKIGTIQVSQEKRYYSSLSGLFYGMVKYQLLNDDGIQSFEQILDLITETKSQLMK